MREDSQTDPDMELIESPWCPLFGALPDIRIEAPPNSQTYRCIDVIKRARIIWGSINTWTFWRDELELSSWPDPEEVPHYHGDLLESARSIFRARSSIFQHIMVIDVRKDYYHTKDGRLKETYTPKQRMDDLAWLGNSSGAYGKVVDDLPDYFFFAILSLGMAWDSIRDLIDGCKVEDDPTLIENVQNATDLVSAAESLEGKENRKEIEDDIKNANKYIEEQEPHAKRGLKILMNASEGGIVKRKMNHTEIQERRNNWQLMANEIWGRKPSFSKYAVAGEIAKTTKDNTFSIDTIRRYINKPSD